MTDQPFVNLLRRDIPSFACCFNELDPIYAPFSDMLRHIDLVKARSNKSVRDEIVKILPETGIMARPSYHGTSGDLYKMAGQLLRDPHLPPKGHLRTNIHPARRHQSPSSLQGRRKSPLRRS